MILNLGMRAQGVRQKKREPRPYAAAPIPFRIGPIAHHRGSVTVCEIFSRIPTRPARGDEACFGDPPSPVSGTAPFEPVGFLRIAPLPCIMQILYTIGRILSIVFSKKCYAIKFFCMQASSLKVQIRNEPSKRCGPLPVLSTRIERPQHPPG